MTKISTTQSALNNIESEAAYDALKWLQKEKPKASVVRPAIVEDIKRKNALNLSVSGRIKCPICAGQVFYKYAGSRNKHIQAICSTPECVQWME